MERVAVHSAFADGAHRVQDAVLEERPNAIAQHVVCVEGEELAPDPVELARLADQVLLRRCVLASRVQRGVITVMAKEGEEMIM